MAKILCPWCEKSNGWKRPWGRFDHIARSAAGTLRAPKKLPAKPRRNADLTLLRTGIAMSSDLVLLPVGAFMPS
jgi:hypothetical protein